MTNDSRTAINSLNAGIEDSNHGKAMNIALDFEEFWAEFHKHPQPYDDKMDAEIHEQYARVLREQSKWGYFDFDKNPQGIKRPHFGPSSAGYSARELYEKARKSKRDPAKFNQNQRDWVGLGSQVGDYVQREILLAERHYKRLTGKEPLFKFERTECNEPAYEHFKKKMHEIEHDGEHFAYFGLPDGILRYTDPDTGEILRVGLEVKSHQKNWSDFKKLDQPKRAHELQTIAYSDMYGEEGDGEPLDYYIVLYVLTYGRDWFEDFSRVKAFGKYITESDRTELRERCAAAVRDAREGNPPAVDLASFKFNDYKRTIALSLSEEELAGLKAQAKAAFNSNMPEWKKRQFTEAVEEIEEIRNAGE